MYLHAGDRVVFYGDSITEQRQYTTFVEAFVATRYPHLDVTFFNRGWAGDTSWGAGGGLPEERARRDVDPLKPTVLFVMLGMNDGGYVPYSPDVVKAIREWYGKTLNALQAKNSTARLTFARTSPWDDYAHSYSSVGKPPEPWAGWKGYNDVLRQYGDIYREITEKKHGLYVDFNVPVSEVIQLAQSKDPELAKAIIPDSIHPGPAGHLVMAAELLKAWQVDVTVFRVSLDARGSTPLECVGTKIKNIKELSWEQQDERLPFAYDASDKTLKLVADLYGFDDALNRQILCVRNLDPGDYDLLIDGHVVQKCSARDLECGVNLAQSNTPMRDQAAEVLTLCHQKAEVEFVAWRNIERADLNVPEKAEALDGLKALAAGLQRKIRQICIPKAHHYQLRKAS
jgi:lysophospholipase L1-like esterase